MPQIEVAKLLPVLNEFRIFLMGPGVNSIVENGRNSPARISYPDDLVLEPYSSFFADGRNHLHSMGAFSYTFGIGMPNLIQIGRYCSIAEGVKVMGDSHPHHWASTSTAFYTHGTVMRQFMADTGEQIVRHGYLPPAPKTVVGNDVWIGANVTLARGITIGDGSVIASNAVVTKDIPPYSIAAGVPARVIKSRFDSDIVAVLLASKWWEYDPATISKLPVGKPDAFVNEILNGALSTAPKWNPTVLTAQMLDNLRQEELEIAENDMMDSGKKRVRVLLQKVRAELRGVGTSVMRRACGLHESGISTEIRTIN